MNVVFDDGLNLDENYRKALSLLLPIENAPLRLNSFTSKTDGTPSINEGFVFITNLPVDVMKYHLEFFEIQKDAPQWFFVLLNKNDHGLTDLRNAARKKNLKNCVFFHVENVEAFDSAIIEISRAKHILKGKTLLLSKHKRSWTANLATILFKESSKYVIMDSSNISDTDAEILLLCGETINDFKEVVLPDNMEPYFIFRFIGDLQDYIEPSELVSELASYFHMTTERVKSRLYPVDIESKMWLSKSNKTTENDAIAEGILLWDRFGLPLSRKEYIETKIEVMAQKNNMVIERLIKMLG